MFIDSSRALLHIHKLKLNPTTSITSILTCDPIREFNHQGKKRQVQIYLSPTFYRIEQRLQVTPTSTNRSRSGQTNKSPFDPLTLPSNNSKLAPPPVEMWLSLSSPTSNSTQIKLDRCESKLDSITYESTP
jgi:hypothetical protein